MTPTPEEKQALKELLYDSCLFQAHPYVQSGVRDKVAALLIVLGRADLVDIWSDSDALGQLP